MSARGHLGYHPSAVERPDNPLAEGELEREEVEGQISPSDDHMPTERIVHRRCDLADGKDSGPDDVEQPVALQGQHATVGKATPETCLHVSARPR